MGKLIKITTTDKESFITVLLLNSRKYLYTENGLINKDEIDRITYICEEI